MVLATKKNCQRVLAASLRVVSAMTGNPPLVLKFSCANGLRIEHLGDIISKAQSWLILNLPVFMFVYIHFNVPPTRITDLVRNVSDEKIC